MDRGFTTGGGGGDQCSWLSSLEHWAIMILVFFMVCQACTRARTLCFKVVHDESIVLAMRCVQCTWNTVKVDGVRTLESIALT